MSSHDPQSRSTDLSAGMAMTHFLAGCLAFPHELFVRKLGTMGERYTSRPEAMIGVLLVPWLCVFLHKPTYGDQWIPIHGLVILALTVLHRIARASRTESVHSRYIGDSQCRPRKGRWGETLFGLLVAAGLASLCDTLGLLHLLATACSRFALTTIELRDQWILQQARDSRLEAEYYADRMRDGH